MEPLAGIPADRDENNQVENLQATPISNSGRSESKTDEFWPLSGKPYFSIVLSVSHTKPRCRLILPLKISKELPTSCAPVVLTYGSKNWGTIYVADQRMFEIATWRTFVNDNDLAVGDACVFELQESNKDNIKFRVQILRGQFPPELEERINGDTSSTPIVIE